MKTIIKKLRIDMIKDVRYFKTGKVSRKAIEKPPPFMVEGLLRYQKVVDQSSAVLSLQMKECQ